MVLCKCYVVAAHALMLVSFARNTIGTSSFIENVTSLDEDSLVWRLSTRGLSLDRFSGNTLMSTKEGRQASWDTYLEVEPFFEYVKSGCVAEPLPFIQVQSYGHSSNDLENFIAFGNIVQDVYGVQVNYKVPRGSYFQGQGVSAAHGELSNFYEGMTSQNTSRWGYGVSKNIVSLVRNPAFSGAKCVRFTKTFIYELKALPTQFSVKEYSAFAQRFGVAAATDVVLGSTKVWLTTAQDDVHDTGALQELFVQYGSDYSNKTEYADPEPMSVVYNDLAFVARYLSTGGKARGAKNPLKRRYLAKLDTLKENLYALEGVSLDSHNFTAIP